MRFGKKEKNVKGNNLKKANSLPNKIFWIFQDLVNTKEKRKYLLIICVPFYIVWGIANYANYVGFSNDIVLAVLGVGISMWFVFLYLFFCQTKQGKKLRKTVEEQ